MPSVYNWQLFKGYLKASLRASPSNCNNIFYITPPPPPPLPFLAIGPQSPLPCGREKYSRTLLKRGLEKCQHTNIYNLSI